jgi:heme-degrading monooxygenase HmoA
MNSETVEIVFFRLADGVSDEAFLAAAAAMGARLAEAPGYRRRELYHDGEGNWVDTIRWDSAETAQAAAEAVGQQPEGQAFHGSINPNATFGYRMTAAHTA